MSRMAMDPDSAAYSDDDPTFGMDAPTGVDPGEALRQARGELEVCEMANDELQDENVRLRELLEDARDCRDPLDPCRDCLKCLHADYEHAIHRLEEAQAQIAELRAQLATPPMSEPWTQAEVDQWVRVLSQKQGKERNDALIARWRAKHPNARCPDSTALEMAKWEDMYPDVYPGRQPERTP